MAFAGNKFTLEVFFFVHSPKSPRFGALIKEKGTSEDRREGVGVGKFFPIDWKELNA